jgi:hypothetical protein
MNLCVIVEQHLLQLATIGSLPDNPTEVWFRTPHSYNHNQCALAKQLDDGIRDIFGSVDAAVALEDAV